MKSAEQIQAEIAALKQLRQRTDLGTEVPSQIDMCLGELEWALYDTGEEISVSQMLIGITSLVKE